MMNLLGQWIVVCAFGLSCWAVGDWLGQTLFPVRNNLPVPARHALSFAAGNVIFSYALTILGFFGFLIPSVLWATFLAGIAVVVVRTICFRNRVMCSVDQEKASRSERDGLAFLFLTAVAGLFIVAAVVQASAPPYVRDSLVYHLLCPKAYLKTGAVHHIGGNLYSAFPQGHEMLMTLLLGIGGERAAQGFSLLQHGAVTAGIFGLVRWMKGPWTAAFCAAGYVTVPPAVYFSGCGYVEPGLVMALLAGLTVITLLLRSWNDFSATERWKGSLFLGLLAGWMAAVKYTGLIYLGLIGLLLLWGIRKEPARKSLAPVGMFALAALPGFCWMLWNWIMLGNPVYPFGWFVFGGGDWDASRATAMSLYFNLFGMGNQFQDYLLLPWRLAFSGRFDTLLFDGAMAFSPRLYIAVPGGTDTRSALINGPQDARRIWLGRSGVGCLFFVRDPAGEVLASYPSDSLSVLGNGTGRLGGANQNPCDEGDDFFCCVDFCGGMERLVSRETVSLGRLLPPGMRSGDGNCFPESEGSGLYGNGLHQFKTA
jgi:hypothetical protein